MRPGWTGCSSTTAAEGGPPPSQPRNRLFLAWLTASAWTFTVPVWSAGSTKPWSIMPSAVAACRLSRYTAPVLIIAADLSGSAGDGPLDSRRHFLQRRRGDAAWRLYRSPGAGSGDAARALLRRLPGPWRGRPATRDGARASTVVPCHRCPVAGRSTKVPTHRVVRQDTEAYDELEPQLRPGFEEYFIVRTPATARRYRDHVAPGTTLVDEAALGRIFAGWSVEVGSSSFSAPTLIVAGRRDSVVGYADSAELLERYPHATLAVIEDAGHAVMHEARSNSTRRHVTDHLCNSLTRCRPSRNSLAGPSSNSLVARGVRSTGSWLGWLGVVG